MASLLNKSTDSDLDKLSTKPNLFRGFDNFCKAYL